jgi:hypothetical protein
MPFLLLLPLLSPFVGAEFISALMLLLPLLFSPLQRALHVAYGDVFRPGLLALVRWRQAIFFFFCC